MKKTAMLVGVIGLGINALYMGLIYWCGTLAGEVKGELNAYNNVKEMLDEAKPE